MIQCKQIITTLGLLFDIAGALMVAFEVIKKFKGQEYVDPGQQHISGPPMKTPTFLLWEREKFYTMGVGLVLLVIGFFLQILAVWL